MGYHVVVTMERARPRPSAEPVGSEVVVEPISTPRASDVLAQQLRERILQGLIPDGTRLPPERELGEQSGLGRSSVREAIRQLEYEGLLETRPGRNGGPIVTRPHSDQVGRALQVFIRGREIRFGALLEARESFEPSLAALAAIRRTEEDLEALRHFNEEMFRRRKEREISLGLNADWHVAIARATHNELLVALTEGLRSVIYGGTMIDNFSSARVVELTHMAHSKVIRCIERREPEEATKAMKIHLHAYTEMVTGVKPEDEDLHLEN